MIPFISKKTDKHEKDEVFVSFEAFYQDKTSIPKA
jgi:hypothetical protein